MPSNCHRDFSVIRFQPCGMHHFKSLKKITKIQVSLFALNAFKSSTSIQANQYQLFVHIIIPLRTATNFRTRKISLREQKSLKCLSKHKHLTVFKDSPKLLRLEKAFTGLSDSLYTLHQPHECWNLWLDAIIINCPS